MTATQQEIHVGDIFRWRYRSEKLSADYLSYWATSQIAVAVEGDILRDTYWIGNDGGRSWTFAESTGRLILTRLANFADLEKISESEAEYYDEADIVNINHGNIPKGNCYKRKGTERSRKVMLDKLDYKVEKAKSAIRSHQRDIERWGETRTQIENVPDLKGIWI